MCKHVQPNEKQLITDVPRTIRMTVNNGNGLKE